MVLCRCNAPLVAPAFELIRQGIKAVILGRDIGTGLLNLTSKIEKKQAVGNLPQLLAALYEYQQVEYVKLLAQKKNNQAALV